MLKKHPETDIIFLLTETQLFGLNLEKVRGCYVQVPTLY